MLFYPLIIALVQGNKGYCNRYCGRGQLFGLLGGRLGLSRKKDIPGWMKSRAFRYGFLVFFLIMFCQMLWNTVLVFTGASDLKQVVTLLWIFKLPCTGPTTNPVPSRHSPVCLWILQRDADLYHIRTHYHGAV